MSKVLTPIKAIRAKCLECCCNQRQEVKLCTVTGCSLYPYRMGHRPKKAAQRAQKRTENNLMDKLSMRGGKRLKWQASPLVICIAGII